MNAPAHTAHISVEFCAQFKSVLSAALLQIEVEGKKYAAKCQLCSEVLFNSARKRLEWHRKKCNATARATLAMADGAPSRVEELIDADQVRTAMFVTVLNRCFA